MLILLYEFITGGGTWSTNGALVPGGSLLREGSAMAQAIAADLSATPGVEVIAVRDTRLGQLPFATRYVCDIASEDDEATALLELGTRADGVVLIAPEFDHQLTRRCELIEQAGGRLLSPNSQVVRICSNKQFTSEHLARRGVPSPSGFVFEPSVLPEVAGGGVDVSLCERVESLSFPLIAKPIDGCGSIGIRWIETEEHLRAIVAEAREPLRVEEFHDGLAASVAVLCGPSGCQALPASTQRLSADGMFQYEGGQLPLPPGLNRRAQALALRAVQTLPAPRGYIGVDLVLGDAADGRHDVVIEINPRLTTSYIGLRAICQQNLAAAMLAIGRGEVCDLSFLSSGIEFSSNGDVRSL